ncbi:MAG: hypothetical protein L0Y66_11830 [Myxococcaceae bacterium]|nr:hypothetical protein [Myxococcaceae bacterium]
MLAPFSIQPADHIFYVKHLVDWLVVDDVMARALRRAGATGITLAPLDAGDGGPRAERIELPPSLDAPETGQLDARELGLDVLQDALRTGMPAREGMESLLTVCHALSPSRLWEGLAALPFERDVAALREWLERLLRQEPPGRDIVSLSSCTWVPMRPMARVRASPAFSARGA